MEKYIVGLGEILWDMLPGGKRIGGAPANFAYHAQMLGFSSAVVSAVGNDHLGDEILENIQSLGKFIQRADYPTGTVNIKLDNKGVPVYEICEGVAWDIIEFTTEIESLAQHCQVAVFGTLAQRNPITQKTIYDFLDAMPDGQDIYKIFDINLRQDFYSQQTIEDSLSRCNILKINNEELTTITKLLDISGLETLDKGWQILEKYQLEIVIITCDAEGSYIFTESKVSFLPTPEVEVVDTVGAGDSFTAAFITSLLEGKGIKESHLDAVSLSAYVCTQSGATPPYPSV